jgi:heme/copper-type cytochrome/quinol oxidase subunit 2
MKSTHLPIVLVVITLTVAIFGLYYASSHLPKVSGDTISEQISCSSYSSSFTIVATQDGFNDSIQHGVPKNYWPIVCVREGTLVTIKIVNEDNVQPHGFSISKYFEGGASVMPGQTYTISFYASQKGYFLIRCNVLCTVHWAMLSGLLIVS